MSESQPNPESTAFFEGWMDESQASIDLAYEKEGPEAAAIASIKWSIRRATAYHNEGFTELAIEKLNAAREAASSDIFKGTGLYETAGLLLKNWQKGTL